MSFETGIQWPNPRAVHTLSFLVVAHAAQAEVGGYLAQSRDGHQTCMMPYVSVIVLVCLFLSLAKKGL